MSNLCDDPEAVAAARGLRVVLPSADELFIDIDDAASEEHYNDMLRVLTENSPDSDSPLLCETKRTTSAHGNAHIYARLGRELTDVERIAWQACLGSDRKRELLSLLRVLFCPARKPTVFFETADVEAVACE